MKNSIVAGSLLVLGMTGCARTPSAEPAGPTPDSVATGRPAGAGASVAAGQASGAGVATVASAGTTAARGGSGADATGRATEARPALAAVESAELARQDSSRKALVAQVMERIAGRENQPAGRVFRNVQLLRDMPARDFLRLMDEQYGRALGFTCANCHDVDQFENDDRANMQVARDMQRMTDAINRQFLAKDANLDANAVRATCMMCHRGSSQPTGR